MTTEITDEGSLGSSWPKAPLARSEPTTGNVWPHRTSATWEPLPAASGGTVTLEEYRRGQRPRDERES
jgi:hypothetical protein